MRTWVSRMVRSSNPIVAVPRGTQEGGKEMGTGKSLTAPERVRRLQAALHAKNGRRHDLIREPDAEDPHVRFDERRLETELWRGVRHRHCESRRETTTPTDLTPPHQSLILLNRRVCRSSGGVQCCKSTSELSFATFVAVHGEGQSAGWANNAPGALDESTTGTARLAGADGRPALLGNGPPVADLQSALAGGTPALPGKTPIPCVHHHSTLGSNDAGSGQASMLRDRGARKRSRGTPAH